ncbi:Uncharacterized protein dnm_086450 [Desulfonema magnum]|uniref:Uncharacterized protein n=1 Tax=Desulfonema magnum TaxID=45655 RepID=A0A975GT27_9BACT|nr:Uncharacterized protein dnm_086450 [Desulfonema magnum]
MRIRRGPAAVTGDESCKYATVCKGGKARQLGRTGSQKT